MKETSEKTANKPLIFLTNDDGVNAKGLRMLIETLRQEARLLVVAPEQAQSGMGHAITLTRPLYLKKVTDEPGLSVYACNGTPVDCVKIAFDCMMLGKEMPSLVVSGINHGSNSAINVLYSGTMGAAIEGGFYDIPSIGFSLLDHDEDADFSAALSRLTDIHDKPPLHLSYMLRLISEKDNQDNRDSAHRFYCIIPRLHCALTPALLYS